MNGIEIHPIEGIPEIGSGDDLAALVLAALNGGPLQLAGGDILVITHKVVSKAEGRIIDAADDAAYRAAVENEARAVIRRRGDLLITQTDHGFICANAGVDRSNVAGNQAVLLPLDPDKSAHRLRIQLARAVGFDVPVIISDTFGRPWRRGQTDVAIGVSGMEAITDHKGLPDSNGRIMEATEVAIVDEIAAAADLAMGKTSRVPAAIVRGVDWKPGSSRATDLVRPPREDLFR
ncbi:MAG: coenzyme F420-0:L-glutamate ligase [Acidimicrobiia bacterium]|nr:coenzyme F420-0:L-glutamate ligase [Acidimicrobiia bacterium]